MNYDGTHLRAQRRAGAKLGFYIHLFVYIAVNLFLIFVNLSTTPHRLWFMWPLFGWGLGLFFHGFAIFVGPKLRQRLVDREIEKDRS